MARRVAAGPPHCGPGRELAAGLVLVLAAAGCSSGGGGGRPPSDPLTVVVAAPLSGQPWVGGFVRDGARLAVDQVNAAGGVKVAGVQRQLRLDVVDDQGTPAGAQAAARQAVTSRAVALVTDGVGAVAVAGVTDPARLPVFVTFEGGGGIIDPKGRPSLFRIAPTDRAMAVRLTDYLANSHPSLAVLSDDTGFGRDGAAALKDAVARDELRLAYEQQVPQGASDVTAQVLGARSSGATALVVWAGAPVVAATIRAARSAGWNVPIYTGPTGEDPVVRQQLADHPEWVDGLTFASFRITAEVGPAPYEHFRAAYDKAFGPIPVVPGVVQPPDWSMFSYDTVNLVAAALAKAGAPGQPLLDALGSTVVTGANGDERGFTPTNHESVSPDDIYFGQFHGMTFVPVADDALSTGLPPVSQRA